MADGQALRSRDGGIGADPAGKLADSGRLFNKKELMGKNPDAVFSALPHGTSAQFCKPFFDTSVVFDLSADFRLLDKQAHQSAYGETWPMPEKRHDAVYTLADIPNPELSKAKIIAVPGCYPTCILLPLIPLAKIISAPLTVNALSGISGAGQKLQKSSLFVERSESVKPYSPGLSHRHHPEIVQALQIAGVNVPLFFTPHLVPIRRGMQASITMWMDSHKEITLNKIDSMYREFYKGRSFIKLQGQELPDTRNVIGSNRCDIGWKIVDNPGGKGAMLYIFSVIDNLLKGASGQAVQAFNLRFGYCETTGLPIHGDV